MSKQTYQIVIKPKKIDEMLNRCAELEDSDHNPFWGETFASGVERAIRWLCGLQDEEPITAEDVADLDRDS